MAKKSQFTDLEDRLNSDDGLRAEFLKDPVKVLTREGVDLSPAAAKSVRAQFQGLQLPKIGSSKPRIGISITITIRF